MKERVHFKWLKKSLLQHSRSQKCQGETMRFCETRENRAWECPKSQSLGINPISIVRKNEVEGSDIILHLPLRFKCPRCLSHLLFYEVLKKSSKIWAPKGMEKFLRTQMACVYSTDQPDWFTCEYRTQNPEKMLFPSLDYFPFPDWGQKLLLPDMATFTLADGFAYHYPPSCGDHVYTGLESQPDDSRKGKRIKGIWLARNI